MRSDARQPRGTVLDCVAVLTAMTLVLTLLDTTFASRGYLVVGLVPVVVLILMALALRRLPEGGWWYVLGALLVFPPLGALVALREPGPYGVPTFETMGSLLSDTLQAPIALVSTVPPVDPSGEVLLVPFMIGFLATLSAAWLALGTSRPVAPLLPITLALGATIPLSALVPAWLVGRSVTLAILLVGWSALRASRAEGSARSATSFAGPLSAVLTVAVVAGVVALVLPETDRSARVLLRGEQDPSLVADAEPPMIPAEGQRLRVLLKATGVPRGQRLRFAVLDQYDGREWVAAQEAPGSQGYGTYKRIGSQVAPLHPGRTVVVRVQMQPAYTGQWLPMLGELTDLDLTWNPGRTDLEDVRYNQATSSALVLGGVDPRDEYSFESVVSSTPPTRRDRTRTASGALRQPEGASLDRLLRPFAREELLPLERVFLLARYLRENGAVRRSLAADQTPRALGEEMLGAETLVGTSMQYTALMALGASRLGVPARVVLGAGVGRDGVVRTIDQVSWVELQFADGTWRALDPERYLGSHRAAGEEAVLPLPPADDFVATQIDQASDGKDREIRPPRNTTPTPVPDAEPRSVTRTVVAVLGLLALTALGACLLLALAKVVRRRRRRSASSYSGVYVNGWQEILDTARDLGQPVPEEWGRVAQAEALGLGLDLARRADAAVFATARPDDDPVDFWRACEVARGDLRMRTRTRRQRWWLPLNPASLVGSWARRRRAGVSAGPTRDEDRRPRRQQSAQA